MLFSLFGLRTRDDFWKGPVRKTFIYIFKPFLRNPPISLSNAALQDELAPVHQSLSTSFKFNAHPETCP